MSKTRVAVAAATALLASMAHAGPQGRSFPDQPRPREVVHEPLPDLGRFKVLTVSDFTSPDDAKTERPAESAAALADQLVKALNEQDMEGIQVRRGEPTAQTGELVLRGRVLTARRGSRAGRYFVGPLAQAKLAVQFELVDGHDGQQVASRDLTRRWAWPGLTGVMKGLPSVVKRTAKAIAKSVAQARHPEAPAGA